MLDLSVLLLHIAIIPSANVTVSELSTNELVTRELNTYELTTSYGHELGVVCETKPSFHVKWILEDDTPGIQCLGVFQPCSIILRTMCDHRQLLGMLCCGEVRGLCVNKLAVSLVKGIPPHERFEKSYCTL